MDNSKLDVKTISLISALAKFVEKTDVIQNDKNLLNVEPEK
jgi:hypothetical protein